MVYRESKWKFFSEGFLLAAFKYFLHKHKLKASPKLTQLPSNRGKQLLQT